MIDAERTTISSSIGGALGSLDKPARITSAIRIPGQTIELSGRIRKKPVRVLLDSGSIGKYTSNHIVQVLDMRVVAEEGFERLTLADGSEYRRRALAPFDWTVGDITIR